MLLCTSLHAYAKRAQLMRMLSIATYASKWAAIGCKLAIA